MRPGEPMEMDGLVEDTVLRLRGQSELRQQQIQARREANVVERNPFESVQGFLEGFQTEIDVLTERISKLRSPDSGEDIVQSPEMELLLLDFKALEEKLAAAAYFLTAYDSKVRQDNLKKVKDSIDSLKGMSRSSKKFSFRKRISRANKENTIPGANSRQLSTVEPRREATAQRDLAPLDGKKQTVLSAGTSTRMEVESGESISVMGNIDCNLRIVGNPGSLQLRGFSGASRIIIQGAVMSSTFIDNCNAMTLFVASGQLRCHDSASCTVYLASRSAPIIEGCQDMEFGALNGLSSELEEVLAEAQIDISAIHWMNVKDFYWLKSTPSPNWKLVALEKAESFPISE